MLLSISNIGWNIEDDENVYFLMKKYGFRGLEIAPTRIISENPYDNILKIKEWKNNLYYKYGFNIPSMQSIWYGRPEKLFGNDEEREILLNYTKKAIDFASAMECKNLVFGCPKNRVIEKEDDNKNAIEFFKNLGEYAYNNNTVIGMEANPTIYNTNYINTTVEALDLIKAVDSKGFLLNLDVGTIIQNNEDVLELKENVKYINHVHISEPNLKNIEKRDLHLKLKEVLEAENYKGYISIEVGKNNNLENIENNMKYISNLFA